MKTNAVLAIFWVSSILVILSFVMTGCDDKHDLKPIDIELMPGVWEVVVQGNQDVFERGCYLDIALSTESSIAEQHGYITTYYLTASGNVLHDEVYSWSIRESDSSQPLLDLVFQGMLDSDDPWEEYYYYRIVRLSESHMWWKGNSVGDDSIIKLRRRNDIRSGALPLKMIVTD